MIWKTPQALFSLEKNVFAPFEWSPARVPNKSWPVPNTFDLKLENQILASENLYNTVGKSLFPKRYGIYGNDTDFPEVQATFLQVPIIVRHVEIINEPIMERLKFRKGTESFRVLDGLSDQNLRMAELVCIS